MKWKSRLYVVLLLFVIVMLWWFRDQSNDKIKFPIIQVDGPNEFDNDFFLHNVFREEEDYHKWSTMKPWDIWQEMVEERSITHQSQKFVNMILKAMSTSKIIKADIGYKGTQLKAQLMLEGPEGQRVIFKPKRYERNKILSGTPYEGYDRHNAEIAAFHLDRLLGFYRAPPAVGRVINIQTELIPVCKKKLLKTFFKGFYWRQRKDVKSLYGKEEAKDSEHDLDMGTNLRKYDT